MEKLKNFDAQLVLNSIYNGIIAIDSEGMITYFNKTAERIFNIPAHEAMNRYILDVLPNTGGKLLDCLKTGKPFYGEKLKGQEVTLISNINPIVTNGKISGAVSFFQDISEIESISKELDLFKNMKNWLDTIIDSSYDGLWICDHQGKVIRINKASERINGVKAEEVIGRNMRELVAEGLCDKSVTLEVLKKKTSVTMIQQIKGEKRILVTGNPIVNEKGEITFVVTNDRDITELDDLRSQLQEIQALAKGYISKLSELEMQGVDIKSIIFRSEEMKRIIEMALRVAPVDTTVLLLGESGVGKGIIAKLIHKHSERGTGPFIRVDCAGIPDSLIESELFGYEKGAFTGAKVEGKPGFFELANKGTLFLDEIGEITLSSQSKLLRFLEDHEIIRVGGTEPKEIDVRVIAATNKNIEEMVKSKGFREDLYYRLNVVPIHIPPLRERREDILPLIFHFLEKFNKNYRKEKVLSPEAIETLCKYDFLGNIRELANIIERLVVITENEWIEARDLSNAIASCNSKEIPYSFLAEGISLKDALQKCESIIIEKSINKYGSQREAAKALKVDQGTISRKIKKFSISKKDVLMHNELHLRIKY
ncbi:MAG: sigma 54-interacting transcriptional regulator [Deltaproteobacteria bacterium]|nr:sigma 54-interacting transcriptional regulator [Deltaproteobacteria bacterium]